MLLLWCNTQIYSANAPSRTNATTEKNAITGDAGALARGQFATNRIDLPCCGDVKRKAGAHCALSACGVPISPWAKWGASVATRSPAG